MDSTMKIWMIVGAVLIILGLTVLAIVMTVHHWDFTRLSTVRYITNTHTVNADFTDISIETGTADLLFAVADDGICKVVCREPEKQLHSVSIRDGVLTVGSTDTRRWFERIGIRFGNTKLTVYLPKEEYRVLTVRESTGDVTLPRELSFKEADISVSTGNIDISSCVSGATKLTATTGDLRVNGISAERFELSASTGEISVSDVSCTGDMIIKLTTGQVCLTDVNCRSLTTDGSTGDLFLTNTVASEGFSIRRTTGDIHFDQCDAAGIVVKTSTGDVTGSLRSEKIFAATTSTGRISVPDTTGGGKCQVSTGTGNITLSIAP